MASKKPNSYDTCAAQIMELVPAVMRQIRGQMRSQRSELSVVQFRALAFLDRRVGASLSDLADHIGLTLPTASKLVQTLLVRGYLHRQTDTTDRRRTAITPTPKGRKILSAARATTHEYIAERLQNLDQAKCEKIAAAMEMLSPLFENDGTARK